MRPRLLPERAHRLSLRPQYPAAACLLLLAVRVSAAVLYVDLNSTNAALPYAEWAYAATNIQDAIDAATAGDLVLVTNGVYQTGGRLVAGLPRTNRVVLDKPLTVASVNGPEATAIVGVVADGMQARCAYLTNGAVLTGFTLTNGLVAEPGTVDAGGGAWCQSAAASLTNCILTGNQALAGGGVCRGTLNNCTLTRNSADIGGGAYQATLNNCVVNRNTASTSGGGTYQGTLNNCTVTGNSADFRGGGAYQSALRNSIVYYNTSPGEPNCYGSTLTYCCTVPVPKGGVGNISAEPLLASASHISAGSPCRAAGSTNYATGVDIDGELWATTPAIGCDEFYAGNLTGPLTVSLSATSTNVIAGYTVNFTGTIAGKAAASAWDFGDGVVVSNHPYASHVWTNGGDFAVTLTAYNNDYPIGVTATQMVHVSLQMCFYVSLSSTNPVAPYADWTTAATDIQSALDYALLPRQTVLVSNGVYQTGGRLVASTWNRVVVERATRVVSVNGPALTSIHGQRAAGGGLGAGAVRCVYLFPGAVLEGFTLTGGATGTYDIGGGALCAFTARLTNCVLLSNYAYFGGGAYSGTLDNCTLRDNSADYAGGAAHQSTLNNCLVDNNFAREEGGGTSYGTLNNCVLTANTAALGYGGASRFSTLNNCVLRGNLAEYAAGAYDGTLNNCTVVDNHAHTTVGGALNSTLNNCIVFYNGSGDVQEYLGGALDYCCTTPAPGSGAGNITNAPLLVDLAGGDVRLQTNSPCINAGRNAYAPGALDLDGNPRITGGTVDIGAYELPSPASVLSYAWAQAYGFPMDGSADYLDPDLDSMNTWQEWIAGTDPTNAASLLRLQSPAVALPGLVLRWTSDTNHTYFLQRATSLNGSLSFGTFRANLPGLPGTTTYTDTTAPSLSGAFYRVGADSTNDSSPLALEQPMIFPGSATLTWSSVTNRSYYVERVAGAGSPATFLLLKTNIPGLPDFTSFTDTNPPFSTPACYRVGVQP